MFRTSRQLKKKLLIKQYRTDFPISPFPFKYQVRFFNLKKRTFFSQKPFFLIPESKHNISFNRMFYFAVIPEKEKNLT